MAGIREAKGVGGGGEGNLNGEVGRRNLINQGEIRKVRNKIVSEQRSSWRAVGVRGRGG